MTSTTSPGQVPLIRVFLSSPGDVADERELAHRLIKDELPYAVGLRGRVSIDAVAWDDPAVQVAMLATETPQQSVNRALPRPADCDIVIVILWSRMGTPLPTSIRKPNGERYESGTEWEYEDAFNADPRPSIIVYRRMEPVRIDLDDSDFDKKREQYQKVKRFFDQFRNPDGSLAGGVNTYESPSEFRGLLRKHLEQIVWDRLNSPNWPSVVEATTAQPPQWEGSPYPGLRAFRSEESAIFFGRGDETDRLVVRLREPDCRFLAVVGASGTGRSSLIYAGLLPRLSSIPLGDPHMAETWGEAIGFWGSHGGLSSCYGDGGADLPPEKWLSLNLCGRYAARRSR